MPDTRERKWWNQPGEVVFFALLLGLNLFSLSTTITGMEQVLPQERVPNVAKVAAISIQLTLFLLLSGMVLKNAPFRRWIVVLAFSATTAYTSFFGNFTALGGDARVRMAADNAMVSYASLRAEVIPALKREYDFEVAEAKRCEEAYEKELKGGYFTHKPGKGPKSGGFAAEAEEHKQRAAFLKPVLDSLETISARNLAGASGEVIFEAALDLWTALPTDRRANVPKPTRDLYVDHAVSNKLIMPLYALLEGDPNALVSALLALIVDGALVILGGATRGRRRNVFDALGAGVAYVITGVKNAGAIIRDGIRQPGRREDRPSPIEEIANEGATAFIELLASGDIKASMLILHFSASISLEDHKVDIDGYMGKGELYEAAGRALMDSFVASRLGWVKRDQDAWVIPNEKYDKATWWLRDIFAMLKRAELEAAAAEANDTGERLVRVPLPIDG